MRRKKRNNPIHPEIDTVYSLRLPLFLNLDGFERGKGK
jgi:hypothetical protein